MHSQIGERESLKMVMDRGTLKRLFSTRFCVNEGVIGQGFQMAEYYFVNIFLGFIEVYKFLPIVGILFGLLLY